MKKYTIHEEEVKAVSLPGREHKMIIGHDHFGKSKNMCFGVATFPAKKHAPSHVHKEQEEILYVLKGKGEMYFDNKLEKIEEGTYLLTVEGADNPALYTAGITFFGKVQTFRFRNYDSGWKVDKISAIF